MKNKIHGPAMGRRKVARGCALALAMACAVAAEAAKPARPIEVSFARGAWNPADFLLVKCWRWDYLGEFDQLDDAIVNRCPELSGEEIFKRYHSKVYSALVHKEVFPAGTTVSSTMSFDYRMAPIVVIAPTLGSSANGTPEFRDHWEACLYDNGLNVWHHYFENGEQKWRKAAALLLPKGAKFLANRKYEMTVKVARTRKGHKEMTVTCGGYTLSCIDDKLPDSFQAGIIACEGRNFFYDFRVR